MMITLRQLQYFHALSQTRHFGRAAEMVNISQPALSLQVKELETSLKVKLVERGAREIVITPQGRELARRAEEILASIRDIETASRWSAGLAGRLHLGIIPTVAPYLLPAALPLIRAQNIALDLRIREAQTETLLAELREGKIDAAVLAWPVQGHNWVTETLFCDHFLLAGGTVASLPVAPDPTELSAGKLLLLDEGHCLADQALDVCSMDRSQTRMDLGASSLSTLCGLAAAGFGLTFVPEIAVRSEAAAQPQLSLRRFRAPEPKRTLVLIRRARTADDGWFHELAEILRRSGEDLIRYAATTYRK